MTKFDELNKLSEEIVDKFIENNYFVSVGWFFSEKLLLLGINPGWPKRQYDIDMALKMNQERDVVKRQQIYFDIIKENYIGKYINQLVSDIHKTSYTNIVKVPVINNDLRIVKEILPQHKPYCMKQIEILSPKLIICLGKFITTEFFGVNNINFNDSFMFNGIEVLLVHHPRYLFSKRRQYEHCNL